MIKSVQLFKPFFSPTVYNQQSTSTLFDACCYHPFDFPWSAFIFFRNLKPSAYIVNRHDVWPHFIVIAKIMNVKLYYINANLRIDSIRIKYFKNFHSWLFRKIDFITTPSDEIKIDSKPILMFLKLNSPRFEICKLLIVLAIKRKYYLIG